jgi:hypothetical protein
MPQATMAPDRMAPAKMPAPRTGVVCAPPQPGGRNNRAANIRQRGRLVHHAEVISLKGDSYRLKDRDLGRIPAQANED